MTPRQEVSVELEAFIRKELSLSAKRALSEGSFDPIASLLRLLFKRPVERHKRRALTVSMLQRAIDLGIWDSGRLMKREDE